MKVDYGLRQCSSLRLERGIGVDPKRRSSWPVYGKLKDIPPLNSASRVLVSELCEESFDEGCVNPFDIRLGEVSDYLRDSFRRASSYLSMSPSVARLTD
jgi:hypothetical protein